MNNEKVWYWNTLEYAFKSRPFRLNFPNNEAFLEYHRIRELEADERTDQEEKFLLDIYEKRTTLLRMAGMEFLPIPKENMPSVMYTNNGIRKGVVLADIFLAEVFVSNHKLADILKQFRLGNSQISEPMRFFDLMTNSYVNDTFYYFINIAERHSYYLPEQRLNPNFPETYSLSKVYHPPHCKEIFSVDNYPISTDALNCSVDIWHDPYIKGSLFLSDALAQALQQSEIDKNLLDLWECALVEPN